MNGSTLSIPRSEPSDRMHRDSVQPECGPARPLSGDRTIDTRMAALLEDYLSHLERGELAAAEAVAEGAPEYAKELRECARTVQLLHGSLVDMRAARRSDETRRLGDYELSREVGRGGMGIVYEARQLSLGRRVALKLLPFAAVLDQNQVQRFQREAQAAAQLHHPHIVPVYAVGCERGVHFYSMQFIDGQSLDRMLSDIRSGEPIAAEEALRPLRSDEMSSRTAHRVNRGNEVETSRAKGTVKSFRSRSYADSIARIVLKVADALDYAHSSGIIHRDIKPSNLLLDAEGRIWVTDFGLARYDGAGGITSSGAVVGTLRYMSPEQAAGKASAIDQRTDIYALGATLYELLTLQPAFPQEDRAELLRRVLHAQPTAPRQLNTAIPFDLETIVLKAMAKDREDRYETARQMADDLQRFLDGLAPQARRLTPVDRLARQLVRHRRVALGAFTALALIACGAMVLAGRFALLQHQADVHLRTAHAVVDRFGWQFARQLDALPESEPQQIALLNESLAYYESFLAYSAGNTDLQRQRGEALLRMGEIHTTLGEIDTAIERYRQSWQTYETMRQSGPLADRDWVQMGLLKNNLGELHHRLGQDDAARVAYQEALQIGRRNMNLESLPADAPLHFALTLSNVAELRLEQGHPEESRRLLEQAASVLDAEPPERQQAAEYRVRLAAVHNNLSQIPDLPPNDSIRHLERAIELQRSLVASEPDRPALKEDLAISLGNLATVVSQTKPDEAEALYRESERLLESLVTRYPRIFKYQLDLAVVQNNVGRLLASEKRVIEAREYYRLAATRLDQLQRQFPEAGIVTRHLDGIRSNLARLEQHGDQS